MYVSTMFFDGNRKQNDMPHCRRHDRIEDLSASYVAKVARPWFGPREKIGLAIIYASIVLVLFSVMANSLVRHMQLSAWQDKPQIFLIDGAPTFSTTDAPFSFFTQHLPIKARHFRRSIAFACFPMCRTRQRRPDGQQRNRPTVACPADQHVGGATRSRWPSECWQPSDHPNRRPYRADDCNMFRRRRVLAGGRSSRRWRRPFDGLSDKNGNWQD